MSFSAGQPYAILTVSPIDDDTAELSEYFTLMITSVDRPDVVEIGSPNTSVITIEDNEPRTYATFCDEKMVDWLGVIWFQFSAIH